MCASWLIVRQDNGTVKLRDVRAQTKRGVIEAVLRAQSQGQMVLSAHVGGRGPVALAERVYP